MLSLQVQEERSISPQLPIYINNVNNLQRCSLMKWNVMIIALIMLLCTAASGQMNPYSTSTPGGAPTPSTPTSPESLGLQAPTDITTSGQTPSVQERSQGLMSASEGAAYASAPVMKSTASSSTYKLVVPSGGYAQNSLYVSYAPQTVASCNLYANLPLWLKTSQSGNIWFYEWYPNGMLDTQLCWKRLLSRLVQEMVLR